MSEGTTKRVLITGGAGFIGTNLAARLATKGCTVTLYDNLSRPGVDRNLAWLKNTYSDRIQFIFGDIRDQARLDTAVRSVDQVFHFAAQVAVTTSLIDPREDYEVNAGGTFNVLEAIRAAERSPALIFTSTNKVYGALGDLTLEKNCTRYQPREISRRMGIGEQSPLDFHSPYGCSKGAADQYVLDYARTFKIPAAVFRMSCIYGPHQMGTEDQGWIAHFLLQALRNAPIVICGDGMQVRDALFVDDLVDAFLLAQTNMYAVSGQAFNIGGGVSNTISLLELLDLINGIRNSKPEIRMVDWRNGDQRYYVSDIRKFSEATGWVPRVSVRDGVTRLYQWLNKTNHSFDALPASRGGNHALLTY